MQKLEETEKKNLQMEIEYNKLQARLIEAMERPKAREERADEP